MDEEKSKQIAPAVVLAQHGNKGAYRDIYIHYYKSIFFVCLMMTGNAGLAIRLTGEIFTKMFAAVDKLGDHMAFEQWFYSLAINICRPHMTGDSEELIRDSVRPAALEASECAVNHDKAGFERCIVKILQEMILSLPGEARVVFFYNCFASLDADQVGLLEKLEPEDAQARIDAVHVLLDRQTEKIREFGIDVSMFTRDWQTVFRHLVAGTFVPPSVHDDVSEALGVDVNPFADTQSEKEKTPEPAKQPEEGSGEKRVKKNFINKSDLFLFFAIIAAALLIFSIVHVYKKAKNNVPEVIQTTAATQQKAVLWNGAAASSFDSGSGTREDPYRIVNGAQLAYLSNLINDGNSYYSSCYYKLEADILLNETDDFDTWAKNPPENEWIPIGYSNSADDHSYFTGTFDGNDHTISGMYISSDRSYTGLFGIIRNGTVKNLTVREAYVEGGAYTGGIAGYFAADASASSGFDYCGFSGVVKSSGNNAGGITGYFRAEGSGNMPSVNACYSSGAVIAGGYAGGIIGVGEADTGSVKIMDSFSNASVTVSVKNGGGIAGDFRAADGNAMMLNCYYAGTVTGGENIGGLSGSAGYVRGEGNVNISFCVMPESAAPAEAETESRSERLIFTGNKRLSADEMTKSESFERFNFDEIWTIENGGGYRCPVLRGIAFEPYSYAAETEANSQ